MIVAFLSNLALLILTTMGIINFGRICQWLWVDIMRIFDASIRRYGDTQVMTFIVISVALIFASALMASQGINSYDIFLTPR